ncbi:hypothetical protein O181_030735 [Austropuccinia psidii MF-1]|uniref:Retrovirus-related Pol polyprotein from transposon TNT 1-94-like beta-barrel domain-containing protein n=1 Tax=Austropuccinia psidii MF-1 TaxID=1389203 RepID=A0A9Q3H6I1_9BASI|nr:hypothetical protein [Austropuccinia psidii MF-1]
MATPKNPCFYCGEAGHWEPKFLAHLKVANARFSSSQRKATVASIGAVPMLETKEALLDSGATHSVIGHISLFTSMKKANMHLLVASSHRFPADAIGNITLMTPQGCLFIKDMLLCKAIKGVVLSIGQLISQKISISLLHNTLTIWQNNTSFNIFQHNHQWFLPIIKPLCPIALDYISDLPPPINPLTRPSAIAIDDINILWYCCLGHLSIRNFKSLLKFQAAGGIPNLPFDHIKILHPCSVAKAEHRPYM